MENFHIKLANMKFAKAYALLCIPIFLTFIFPATVLYFEPEWATSKNLVVAVALAVIWVVAVALAVATTWTWAFTFALTGALAGAWAWALAGDVAKAWALIGACYVLAFIYSFFALKGIRQRYRIIDKPEAA